MTRAELARDLDAVARSLILAAAVIENLAFTLQEPQDGLDIEDDVPVVPATERGAPGKGSSLARRAAASLGELPATPERPMDRTGLPPCACPPCLAERAEGRRP